MYFKIDEDDRIILCPQNEKDLEKLERVYHKMKHKGLEQIEIVLELPKEDSNKKYYSDDDRQRMQEDMRKFGFNPDEMEQAVGDNLDVYSHFYPFALPFWFERYGYDMMRRDGTGRGGRDGYNRSGEYGAREGWNERDPNRDRERKGGDGIVGERDGRGGRGRGDENPRDTGRGDRGRF
jgi:hypothetical protein